MDRIVKHLDHFLVSKALVDLPIMFGQWVSVGGESDHLHMVLEMVGVGSKPLAPFKFNSLWLNNDNFVKLIKTIMYLLQWFE